MDTEKVGEYAFLAGMAVAILAALGGTYAAAAIASVAGYVPMLLVLLGVVVGLVNVAEKNATAFIVAAIALVTAGTASFTAIDVAQLGALLNGIVTNLAALASPAAVIVAAKAIYAHASGQ